RTEVTKIEIQQRVNVQIVANKTLETPNYRLERLKVDDSRLDNPEASYKLAEEIEDPLATSRRSKEPTNRQTPLIKSVLPDAPPPAATKPEPVAAAAPAVSASLGSALAGWVERLKTLFGFGAPAAPAVQPQAQPEEGGKSSAARSGERRRSGGERSERRSGEQRGRSQRSSNGQSGRGGNGRQDGIGAAEAPRQERGERRGGERAGRERGQERAEAMRQPQRPRREATLSEGSAALDAENGQRSRRQPRAEREPGARDEQLRSPLSADAGATAASLPLADAAATDAQAAALQRNAAEGSEAEGQGQERRERRQRDRYGRHRRRQDRDSAPADAAQASGAQEQGEQAQADWAEQPDSPAPQEPAPRRRSYFDRVAQDDTAPQAEPAPQTAAAEAAAAAPALTVEPAQPQATAEPVNQPAPQPVTQPAPEPAAQAPAPSLAQPFVLDLPALSHIVATAGLDWVHSDADKVARVQAEMAAAPKPVHVPRERPPVPVLDQGPLVLVETRRDLRQQQYPFDQAAHGVQDCAEQV
ncbi:MAG: ribonuclease E/G, partial [Comamonadaceae bacterium]|nr:ribonuclease E/G [Comamonadaceae bacterium]